MKLIGPWFSSFTRRVGITLNLLGIPYEHVPLHAFNQRDEVKNFNAMGKVPILVLDTGERLIDSSAIVDYLDELVGPQRALIPRSGDDRRRVLQLVAVALATAEKAGAVYYERSKVGGGAPALDRTDAVGQTLSGLEILEARATDGWFFDARPTQADITAVVAYQTALRNLEGAATPDRFPRLAALTERAMADKAFSSTVPAS